MYCVAKDTGWPEEYIIWKLPLARSLQYYHCALQAANLWTLEPTSEQAVKEMVPDTLLDYIDGIVDSEDNG